jgi:hypothetical protein
MLIGALLRVPAQAIQTRIIRELNSAGFRELNMPHMAVFRFPSPDGEQVGGSQSNRHGVVSYLVRPRAYVTLYQERQLPCEGKRCSFAH